VRGWEIVSFAGEDGEVNPVFEHKLHKDAVGSVQLHPFKPLLMTAAGSRDYLKEENGWSDPAENSSDESDTDEESGEDGPQEREGSGQGVKSNRPTDTALRIWSMSITLDRQNVDK